MKVKFSIVLLVLSLFIYFAGCIDPKAKVSSTVSDPVISPQGGIYDSAQTVSISCPTSGAQIRYSVDGEDPTESSGIVYSGPFSVSDDAAVKAIAYRSGWKSSSVVFESFIIDETIYTVAVPEISPVSGTYTSAQAVTISCTTEDSTIMYTVDGSTPDESGGIEYTGSFIVSSNTTVRAVAFRDGWETSSVAVADYIITGTVADPVISPDAGTYTSAQTVSISCATGGAAIHYTIDGSIPDESSGIVYSGPFSVASTATVRAIAVLAGWDSSSVVSSSYVITGTAAAPVFSPDSGTYTTAQSITLSTATASASIRYTTNGNDPDETYGILYSGPFTVSSDTTVKAVAFLDEWETSAVSSAEYIITGTVADPLISPAGGTYTSAQSVSISCSTGGAAIKYTTDGSTPSESNGTVYSGSFTVSSSMTVRAIAYLSGWDSSAVTSASYTITGTIADPVISPAAGTYTSARTVSISCSSAGAVIRYTVDGSLPTESSGTVYSASFTVSSDTVVNAIAYRTGWETSGITTVEYIITGTVDAPVFSPGEGTYITEQLVSISSATGGAQIRYTTDGSIPTESIGTLYTGPVTVSSSMTLRAVAWLEEWATSSVSSAEYTITGTVADPVFSPSAGVYTTAQSVSISCSTVGSGIRYTTDGSDPTDISGTVYSGPFTVSADTEVRAVAYRTGWATSNIASAEYIITGTVADPQISPASGTYTSARTVSISCTTDGASIRYTVDDSSPTETYGTLYSGSFTVSENTTVRAIAYRTDWETSNEASAVYTITGTVEAPVILPVSGVYTSARTVTISCATSGATIRYTADGSTPTETAGTVYAAPLTVSEDTTIMAVAYLTGWDTSSVTSAVYTITGTVDTPVIAPSSGTYTETQSVSISCSTAGAEIRYTTDGSTPSETVGIYYSGPIEVSEDTTVRAAAYLEDWETSSVASASYIITGTVADPVMSPSSGVYTSEQDVSISCSTPGASIRYTTDGSVPDESTGTLFSAPFTVSENTTVRAVAYLTDWNTSTVTTAVYTITGTVEDPVISPVSGTYTEAQTVSISCATAGASVRYTTDGTIPSESTGTVYTAPFTVSADSTVRAVAYLADWETSDMTSASYVITGTVADPVFSPSPGSYSSAQSVTISCATGGASIRYTTDGTTPTESAGTVYSGPITVSSSMIINAVAYRTDWITSAVVSAEYIIAGGIIIDPGTGEYSVEIQDMPDRILRNHPVTVSAVSNHSPDNISWYVDGSLIQSGASASFVLGTGLGMGNHNVTASVTSGNVQYSVTEDFKVIFSYSIDELDFEDGILPEDFDPSTDWSVVSGGAESSLYSIKSGEIGSYESTSAFLIINPLEGTGSITVNFDRRVSCMNYYHYLAFYVNDVLISPEWDDELDWESFSYEIDVSGMTEIILEWRYTKGPFSTGSGEDSAWIDNISAELR